MKKIALEEHVILAEWQEIQRQWSARTKFPPSIDPDLLSRLVPRLFDLEAFRLPEMDANDITVQVLSIPNSIQKILDPAEAVMKAKQFNDYEAELIRKHPTRFAGFASLPLQDPQAAADEFERTVTQLSFKGAMINGHTHGEYVDERKFWVVWERAKALGVPLYLHPTDPLADQIKIYEGHQELLGSTWDWGVETATQALRVVFSGVFDAFPKATLILGHLGEMLPYALTRLDRRWEYSPYGKKLNKRPSEYIKENVLITTSGNFSPEALICAILTLGADHILYAVDYPFESMQEATQFIENAPISDLDKEKICHLNAERLLGLEA